MGVNEAVKGFLKRSYFDITLSFLMILEAFISFIDGRAIDGLMFCIGAYVFSYTTNFKGYKKRDKQMIVFIIFVLFSAVIVEYIFSLPIYIKLFQFLSVIVLGIYVYLVESGKNKKHAPDKLEVKK